MLQWKARFAALITLCALIAAAGGFFGLENLARNIGW
jgi:hypothetical protein